MSLTICRRPPAACQTLFPRAARGLFAAVAGANTGGELPHGTRAETRPFRSARPNPPPSTSPTTTHLSPFPNPEPSNTHSPGA